MENTQDLICKTCGSLLNEEARQSTDGLVTCPYCHNVWTIPRKETASAALQFLQLGEHELDICRFDDAYSAYQKAAEIDPQEPEAYFGMALAEFKVQYLKDETSEFSRLQPICHEISDKNFMDNKNFQSALKYASNVQKTEYLRRAQEIVKIRLEFLKLKESGLDYDCFICVKVSGENGETTQDSHEALKLYHYLKDKGYMPFYSEEEARGRSGANYEALILYALYSSECMLILCTNEEYLKTKWVKNEYVRFSKMMSRDMKEADSLTFVFKGTPIERLPGRDEKIQGIDLSKPDAYSRIEEYVSSFKPIAIGGEVEIKRKEYTGGGYKKKPTKRQGVVKRELSITSGEVSISDKSKLKVANDFILRRDFTNAIKFLNNILRINQSDSEAYYLKFLAEHSCTNEIEYISKTDPIDYADFEKAIGYAGDKKRADEFYDFLYRHVENCKDLKSYIEYIELPGSSESKIAQLTDIMYRQRALPERSRTVFDELIRTVTDTDKFINMNIEFAAALGTDNISYYKNVLTADEGNGEALWYVFASEHYSEDELFLYCAENSENLEKELFEFGYNDFANEKLFKMSLKHIPNSIENACKLFDFVLSMIPKKQNKQFKVYINMYIENLFEQNQLRYINKYNELLLGIDKLDDNAYFNRVMLKNKYRNALQLINIADKLFDDEDYFSAINCYAESHPDKSNFYLDLQNVLADFAESFKLQECRDYLIKKFSCKKEILIDAQFKNKLLSALSDEANSTLKKLLMRYGVKSTSDLYSLRTDVTTDPIFIRFKNFAYASQNYILIKTAEEITENQPLACRHNISSDNFNKSQRRKSRARSVALTLFAILSILSVPASVLLKIHFQGLSEQIYNLTPLIIVSAVAFFVMIGFACSKKNTKLKKFIPIFIVILFAIATIIYLLDYEVLMVIGTVIIAIPIALVVLGFIISK